MTDHSHGIPVTVRFFAAAAAAAERESVALVLPAGSSIDDVIDELLVQCDDMALVMPKCSFLCDGIAVRDRTIALVAGQTLDVLPPFSGG